MTPVQTIRLELNLPVVGTVRYLDWYAEKENPKKPGTMMASQYGIKGTFTYTDTDGVTHRDVEGRIYLDEYQLAADPIHLGMAISNGEKDGIPQFKWTELGKIHLVKREDGRKRIIQIARVRESTGPIPAQQTPPLDPRSGVNRGAFRPTIPPPTNGNPVYVPVDPHHQAPAILDEWAALEARYARCAEIACHIWQRTSPPMDDAALVAAAATLFIEANKEHLQTDSALRLGPVLTAEQAVARLSGIPPLPAPDTSGPPRPEQIAQFRALAGNETFTPAERGTWLERLGQHLYSNDDPSLRNDLTRMGHLIATRTSNARQPASRTAGGPGMPGAEQPEAVEGDAADMGLPF